MPDDVTCKWDLEADVVVVGFGAAGGAAAIEAADAGAKVLILEKTHRPGGATRMSGGIVYGAGTSVQHAAGIEDSADEMYAYYRAISDSVKDRALFRVLADHSAAAIEWLMQLGADFPPELVVAGHGAEAEYAHVTPAKPRSHRHRPLPGGSLKTGPLLFDVIERAVKARPIDVLLETSASELITNSAGTVVGLRAQSCDRELCVLARRGVVLSDGGFAHNRAMLKEYCNVQSFLASGNIALGSHPGQTGDGIKMAMQIGADVCGMAWCLVTARPFVRIGPPLADTPGVRLPSILVNKMGRRFANEDRHYSGLAERLTAQDSVSFQVFDDDVMRQVSIPDQRKAALSSAPTICDLAKKLDVREDYLDETVTRWNLHAERGVDPEFGKTGETVRPIKTSPFWGGELKRRLVITLGGLRTNADARVLDVLQAEPIPGLYAAGQTTGGRFGSFYPGSGSALADCFVFGRIAGKKAAAERPRVAHEGRVGAPPR